jgi:hypothetical protein
MRRIILHTDTRIVHIECDALQPNGGLHMARISGRAATRSRCLWKADQVIISVKVYLRNGGYQDLKKGNFSKIEDAFHKLKTLRATALTKAEHESFRHRIRRAVEVEVQKEKSRSGRDDRNLVSSKEAAAYKKMLKDGKRSMDPANRLWVSSET